MSMIMTSLRREYDVTVSHPTGYHKGTHRLTVKDSVGRDAGTRYVSGSAFGCSRDYFTKDDATAIRMLLAEHACTAVKIRKIRSV